MHVDARVAALPPDRVLSFVETPLDCVLTHLPRPRREVIAVSRFDRLARLVGDSGARAAAHATTYRFDAR